MKALISGLSSPLGRAAAIKLLEAGYEVSGFSRNPPKVPVDKAKYFPCDLRSEELFDKVEGYDLIVHLAALSSPWGKKKDFFDINATGTQRLVKAALDGGCKRFVYISTPAVYFSYKDHLDITEDFQAKRFVNHYAASKFLAEQHVLQGNTKGLETFILRPKALFGPGDSVLVPRILKTLSRGGVPRFRTENVVLDVTYIDNVADAIVLACLADPRYSGGIYNITNDDPQDIHQLIKNLCRAMGLSYVERKVPYSLAKLLSFLMEKASFLTSKEPLLTPYSVGALAYSQTLSIEKAKQELGYQPRVSIQEGIERYAKWWKDAQNL